MTGRSRWLVVGPYHFGGSLSFYDFDRGSICSGLEEEPSVSYTIEEKGYEVLFRDGKVLLFPIGSSITSAKVIGTRQERLYKFLFLGPSHLICEMEIKR
jgi:hypothetical protein